MGLWVRAKIVVVYVVCRAKIEEEKKLRGKKEKKLKGEGEEEWREEILMMVFEWETVDNEKSGLCGCPFLTTCFFNPGSNLWLSYWPYLQVRCE